MLRLRTLNKLATAALTQKTAAKNIGYASITQMRQQSTAASAAAEPFLSGSSSNYIEDMYDSWQRDPNSVHKVQWITASVCEYLDYHSHEIVDSRIRLSFCHCRSSKWTCQLTVYEGLISVLEIYSSNELSSVVAHEMGYIHISGIFQFL